MSKIIPSSRKGVTPVIGTVLIIALVVAASALIATFLSGIFTIDIPSEFQTPEEQDVLIVVTKVIIADTNANGMNNSISIELSLDVDSPNITVTDIDILLPTGDLVDNTVPWEISYSTCVLNSNLGGYVVLNGHTSNVFNASCSDLSTSSGELQSGQSFYFIICYKYLSFAESSVDTITAIFQSAILVA